MSLCGESKTKSFFKAIVVTNKKVNDSVFELVLQIEKDKSSIELPQNGQFYMLRPERSEVYLSRPISVYRIENNTKQNNGILESNILIHFLILVKGKGTNELLSLKVGDKIHCTGPLGNTFITPKEKDSKICIIGGGIGVAPVAGFAETLKEKSYDFFACFKSGTYGLDYIKPENLYITTDDGSVGVKGIVSAILTEELLKQKKYSVVYACGPEKMLEYVQKICRAVGVKCWLSMESRMACGVGACLGCTIYTTEGNKRCCKDGPVFSSDTLIFPQKEITENTKPSILNIQNSSKVVSSPDLKVHIGGVEFNNPIIAASGTFGYGSEYAAYTDINRLGGICSKGLTLEPKPGNKGIRLVETASGLINSIGLENPGIKHFIDNELKTMLSLKPRVIANLSGSSEETYVKGAELLDKTEIDLIELNISCPNVKAGGMAFGLDPTEAAKITKAVRQVTSKPLIVKLSPNAPDIISVTDAVRISGANAISLVNTFQATSIDIERGCPMFDNIRAGYSGAAIKPIALRIVYDVCNYMRKLKNEEQIPVIGLGGISCWQDAVEFIMAGASAIEVGTATFRNPGTMVSIIEGLTTFMERKKFQNIQSMCGIALR